MLSLYALINVSQPPNATLPSSDALLMTCLLYTSGQRVGNAFNVRWQRLAGTDANIRYYNLPADITYFFQGAPQGTSALYVISSPDELAEIRCV